MGKLFNLARMTTATTGTGTITLGSAVSGYLSFAVAGVSDSDVVTYAISDGANSEIGTGTYTASGTTLTRTVIKSTNSDAAINLSGSAEVFVTAAAEDIKRLTVNIQVFTASGTYTPTAGMVYCIVECIGGGGGGGGSTGAAGYLTAGGGGGGGSYTRSILSAATVGASKAVAIGAAGSAASNSAGGAGGDTTFNTTTVVAKGGTGGALGTSGAFGTGGAGAGTGSAVGDLKLPGTGGGAGPYVRLSGTTGVIQIVSPGSYGGGSVFGGGGKPTVAPATSTGTGNAANGYGGGGSGGISNFTATNTAGGAGGAGICIITEFIETHV